MYIYYYNRILVTCVENRFPLSEPHISYDNTCVSLYYRILRTIYYIYYCNILCTHIIYNIIRVRNNNNPVHLYYSTSRASLQYYRVELRLYK